MKSDYEFVTMGSARQRLWRFPLTSVLFVAFAVAWMAGIFYTFGLSDSAGERIEHAAISLVVILWLGVVLLIAKQREERGVFPIGVRRWIWFGIVAGYLIAAAMILWTPFSVVGYPKLRAAFSLGLLAPIPLFAWRLLREKSPSSQHSQLRGADAPRRG